MFGVHLLAVGGEIAEVTLPQRGGLFFRLGKFEFPATFRLEEGVLAASGLSYR